ncbi:MAG: hypothetical protein [Vetruanivirus porcinprimi]|uniref:Uncharacterized protein n=1 Tax=phage Lak_Megaphage_RVC_AP1_GC26 TaxID=3109224 RepID=A0ABZ0Z5S5_9CAUD|nr:MAG: hypothetical protein [phage Lak_Megaphage_RVC_AP1_GC26]
MGNNVLDLHRNFIDNQKRQIDLANKLIECANDNEEIIVLANELIKSCEKCISIEQNMNKNFIID